jgi:transposase
VSVVDRIDDFETAKHFLRLYEKENERLHKRLQQLVAEIAELRGEDGTQQLALELAKVQEDLAKLQQQTFGESSERRPRPAEAPPTEKPRLPGHGPRQQPQLPIQEVLCVLPREDRACPSCGNELQEMVGITEDSEQITVVQRHFVLQEIKRQKYRCKCQLGVQTAPGPTKHIAGGRYSLEFAVEVATNKYADHLPLERQRKIMAREGLIIDTQTLWDQLDALAVHLKPTYKGLREYVLGADLIAADETWWRLMNEDSSKRWWAWGLATHDAVWYGIDPSRSAAAAKKMLGDYNGIVMCDGYAAYDTLASGNENMKLVHCWAHARRKFIEAEQAYPVQAKAALDMIGELFGVERELEDPEPLDGDAKQHAIEARLAIRAARSKPILDRLRNWAYEQMALPRSSIRKAIEYMLRYWSGLTAFVDEPLVPLDNNRVERALRGMVLGRKNHFGSRSRRGTEVAAIFYSLIETAKLRDVDPRKYLLSAADHAIHHPGAVSLNMLG